MFLRIHFQMSNAGICVLALCNLRNNAWLGTFQTTLIWMVQQCPKNRSFVKMGCSLTKCIHNSLISILFVHFCSHSNIEILFLAWTKLKNHQKCWVILLLISCQFCTKRKNYFGLSIRDHP